VWLKTRGRDSEHLFDLNLLKATDSEIWQRAKAENLIIMSEDVDFYDRVLLLGPPPQVIHVIENHKSSWSRRGNSIKVKLCAVVFHRKHRQSCM
jgi:predicted nuclease of predicted toxin-antitoxin system